jgi:hypothetical protein
MELQTILEVSLSTGAAIAGGLLTTSLKLAKLINKQAMNGDNRTLRMALDDLAFAVKENHLQTSTALGSIKERIENLEGRLVRVESQQ